MRVLAAILAVTFLSGCAGISSATIYRDSWSPLYSHRDLMITNGNKDMLLVVHSVPAKTTRTEFVAALEDAMRGHNAGLPIRFTEMPQGEGGDAPTRIVVQADAAPSASTRPLCETDGPTESVPDGSLDMDVPELLFAYCRDNGVRSSLRLQMGRDAVPGSSSFDAAIANAMARLLPTADPYNKAMGCQQEC